MKGKRSPKRKRIVDITVRLQRKDGRKVAAEEAKAALWAAHKIAQAGGNVVTALREWNIHAIDWRNTYASGRDKTFHYSARTSDLSEVLGNMGGILETAGLKGLRVALVNKGEQ